MIGATVVAIKWAADAEEAANKFDVVFGGAAASVRKELRSFAAETNQSATDLEKLTGNIGDVVGAIDGMGDSTKDVSLQLTKLAVDASSFKNVSVDQAAKAFTSALTGEREALKSLGVVINEDMVKMKAFQLGLTKGKKDLTQSAKATATVALLTEKLSTSIDDAKNTAGSFTNRVRGLWAAIRDLGREYGDQIIKGAGLAELFGTIADKVRALTGRIMESRVIEKWAAKFRTEINALVDWVERFAAGGALRQEALRELGDTFGSIMTRAGDAFVDQIIMRSPEIARAMHNASVQVGTGLITGAVGRKIASRAAKDLGITQGQSAQLGTTLGRLGGSIVSDFFKWKKQGGEGTFLGSKGNSVHVADAGGPDSVVGVSSK